MSVVDDRRMQEVSAAWEERRVWRAFVITSALLAVVYPLANFLGAPPGTEPLRLRLAFAVAAIVLCVPTIVFPQLRRYATWLLRLEILAFYIVQGMFLANSGFSPDVVERGILVISAVPLVAPTILDVALALGTFMVVALITSYTKGTLNAEILMGPFGSLVIACIIAAAVGAAFIASRRGEIRARVAIELGLEERLALMRTRDRLTGLPNFERFTELCEDAIESAYVREAGFALVSIVLDRLSEADFQYGTRTANQLVVEVARRLELCAGKGLVCRIRSDRFMIVAMDVDSGAAEELAYALIETLVTPFDISDVSIYLTATAGVAIYPNDGTTVDALLARCDYNIRRAQGGYHDAVSLISGEPDAHMARMHELREDVRYALAKREFVLFYQPCVDSRTRRVVSAEALLRWIHPKYGLIPPAEFISLLESDGEIASVGEWVLREAAQACAQWRNSRDLEVSVNVSLKQFRDAALRSRIRSALDAARLPATALILELTESVAVQNLEYTVQTINACREWGVKFALDDFGTGYSSMGYLKDLPIDEIKIDRSFIGGVPQSVGDCAIVRAIISLGRTRGCTVYAEGIERADQARWLTSEGCDVLQGSAVSPPLSPSDFRAWVASAS